MAIESCETYIELLSTGGHQSVPPWAPYSGYTGEEGPQWDVTYLSTFRPLNTTDFDGSPSCKFEILANNASHENAITVHLVDEDDAVYASIEVPANTVGAGDPGDSSRAGWDFFRFEASFTPLSGDHQYGLRVVNPSRGYQSDWGGGSYALCLGSARIKIRQESSPTKSVVHIPLFDDVNGNGANLQFGFAGGPDSLNGVACKSDGSESLNWTLNNGMSSTPTYPDCEISGPEYLTRNIFKFEEAFLKPVSKLVFDASIGYRFSTASYSKSVTVFGVPTLTGCRLGVWRCNSSIAAASGSTGWQTDNPITAGGETFTYVGGDFYWRSGVDDIPQTYTIHIDPGALSEGEYLYIAGLVDVYGHSDPSLWGAWNEWNSAWQIPTVSGQHLSDIYLVMTVAYNSSLGRNEVTCSITAYYEMDSTEVSTVNMALWDLTAGAVVPSSELTWNEYTPWQRKSVEIDLDEFIDGHEYIVRWKTDGNLGAPRYSDANLWISVNPIENFSSWLRVMHGSNSYALNWYCYQAWGERPYEGYSDGSISNNALGKLFLPANAIAYFEATVFMYSGTLSAVEFPTSWLRAALWDIGTDDSGIGEESSPEIDSSKVVFDQEGYDDGFLHRVRSGEISGLVDGNRYGNNQPDSYANSTSSDIVPAGGFLIVKYASGEAPAEPATCDGTDDIDLDFDTRILTGTGTGSNATKWRVIRTSDDEVMDSGPGDEAAFWFPADYETEYQLQFAGDDDVYSTDGCTFTVTQPSAACLGVTGIAIDQTTLTISGSGTGEYATQWRVIRVSDNAVMDSGSGMNAAFSFEGQYNTQYQLQFSAEDDFWSVTGCLFTATAVQPAPTPDTLTQPINPKVILQLSNDSGATWGNEHWRDPGRAGEYRTRVKWNRLGRSRARAFKIVVSDPCRWIFMGALIEQEEGTGRR